MIKPKKKYEIHIIADTHDGDSKGWVTIGHTVNKDGNDTCEKISLEA